MKLGTRASGVFRVYHGTDAQFTKFSLDFAGRPSMSGNGHLGIWVAATCDLAKNFGLYSLLVHMQVRTAYRMSIDELSAMNRHCQKHAGDDPEKLALFERVYYTDFRKKLLAAGYDTIFVVEQDSRIAMAIALDPSNLVIAQVLHAVAA